MRKVIIDQAEKVKKRVRESRSKLAQELRDRQLNAPTHIITDETEEIDKDTQRPKPHKTK